MISEHILKSLNPSENLQFFTISLMNQITLITNKICPYARKANIALREKSNEFKTVEEDLQNKSEYFKETYSKAIGKNAGKDGLVPIIIDDGLILSQSQPIVWYISQKYQNEGYDLIPKDHVDIFKMRLFIEEYSRKINALQMKYFGWTKKSEQEKQKLNQEINQFFEKLNEKLVLPYALGEQFTIADILIYPHLELWPAIGHYTGCGIDEKYEKVHKYLKQIQARKSVADLILSKQTYVQVLQKYF